MRSIPTTSMYLNTNYRTKSGLYSVKLRLTYRRTSKYFKTGISMSVDDFNKSYNKLKPRGKYIEIKEGLLNIERKAQSILQELDTFSFQNFRDKFYEIENVIIDNVFAFYDRKIEDLEKEKRFGTKTSYAYSKESLYNFVNKDRTVNTLSFHSITPKFLERFEIWMEEKGKSKTTVGIYLRGLRSIINQAIREGILPIKKYPFGLKRNGLYPIPKGNNTKKALNIEHIKKIREYDVGINRNLEFARDFWLLSFYCGGINSADLLRLRHRNYNGSSITFIREKTKGTRQSAKETVIQLTNFAIALIEKYKTNSTNPNHFLFDIIDNKSSKEREKIKVDNFNNFVRKQMNKLAEKLDIPIKLGMMHARHSFANVAWNKQIPVSYIAECMAHSSTKTTSSYLKNISEENKVKTMNAIFEGI